MKMLFNTFMFSMPLSLNHKAEDLALPFMFTVLYAMFMFFEADPIFIPTLDPLSLLIITSLLNTLTGALSVPITLRIDIPAAVLLTLRLILLPLISTLLSSAYLESMSIASTDFVVLVFSIRLLRTFAPSSSCR